MEVLVAYASKYGARTGIGLLPAGDFRDWDAIDAWGAQIAGELSRATTR